MAQTYVNFLTQSGSTLVIDPRAFDFEITSEAQSTFIDIMNNFVAAFNNTANSEVDESDTVQVYIAQLNGWSQLSSGTSETDPTTANTGYNLNTGEFYNASNPLPSSLDSSIVTSTMNRYMAEYVDRIIRTFRSAGWDPIADGASADDAYNAIMLVNENPSIYQVLHFANLAIAAAQQAVLVNDASTQSQSLQQLLMVDYISRGNELLFEEMNQLQQAIDLNQNTLSYLNGLQDLMNQKDPQQFLMQLQLLSTTNPSSLSTQSYTDFENQSFNQQLGTIAKFTQDQLTSYVNTLYSLGLSATDVQTVTQDQYNQMVGTVGGALLDLSTVQNMTATFDATDNGFNTILNNLNFLVTQLTNAAGGSATQLVQALQTISTDISNTQNNGGIVTWVQDYTTSREGDNQRHLNDAIVASQSLNDTEREELRRVMFIFEEFYKSATAMLNRLTQLLEKMASAIAR